MTTRLRADEDKGALLLGHNLVRVGLALLSLISNIFLLPHSTLHI
jgi:hypothetical protein